MSEAVAANPVPSYRDLIKEVFIDPIRTAVVVDDEYPTLDKLLQKSIESREPLINSQNLGCCAGAQFF
ncbi:hypothetical protein F6R98_13595 [Candidatus Methylospira mobilis]|uniref:Uncharacterized protein n=1 Tax=Candidatus Methylospira mobilis TaxID=1808979 RepID=A0A5Q0BMT5_9GAMM|nr:hypothetical protein [Candidatus Methylospira mobilis]QFY43524.1 hypothetical protein F6R98_13595 [Candidatus Methylospira mobilis]